MLDLLMQNLQVRRVREVPTIQIPDLDNARVLLRTDSDPYNRVARGHRTVTQNRRGQVPLKHLDRIPPPDFQTVCAAVYIPVIFP